MKSGIKEDENPVNTGKPKSTKHAQAFVFPPSSQSKDRSRYQNLPLSDIKGGIIPLFFHRCLSRYLSDFINI
jgi:hypothetical protein